MQANGDEAGDTLAVKHNFFGQLQGRVIEGRLENGELSRTRRQGAIAGPPVGQEEDGVVGAHVAVHGDAIKTFCDRLIQRGLQRFWIEGGVGGQEAEHGGVERPQGRPLAGGTHARLNHARAFADAAQARNFVAELEFDGDFLGPRVARHNRLGSVMSVVGRGLEQAGGLENSLLDVGHGQGDADAARGSDQNITGGNFMRRGRQGGGGVFGHGFGIAKALPAGAGVGVAGIDHHGARAPALDLRRAPLDRRGANLVGGKRTGHRGGRIGNDQGQIAFLAFVRAFAGAESFDVAKDPGSLKALRGGHGTFNRFKGDIFHQWPMTKIKKASRVNILRQRFESEELLRTVK